MIKADLVKDVTERTNEYLKLEGRPKIAQKDVACMVDALMESIVDTLESGDEVRLVGFGIFETVERGGHDGRNPKTGETIAVPLHRVPRFKPCKEFKARVR
jgi:DNA-binding protein HU-beta